MKTKLLGLIVFVILGLYAPANANTITYTLNDVTVGGDSLTGSFTYNPAITAVIDAVITVTGSSPIPSGVYTAASYGCSPCAQFEVSDSVTDVFFLIVFTGGIGAIPPVDDPVSGVDDLSFSPSYDDFFSDVTGSADPITPVPPAFSLFGTVLGLGGLYGWRRKRKNAAAIAAA